MIGLTLNCTRPKQSVSRRFTCHWLCPKIVLVSGIRQRQSIFVTLLEDAVKAVNDEARNWRFSKQFNPLQI